VIGLWQDRLHDPLALLATLVQDDNQRVRLEAVVACSYVPKAKAMEVAARAVNLPRNQYLDYALLHTVHALGPHWRDAFVAGTIDFDDDPERIAFVLGADGSQQMLAFLQNPKLVGRLGPKLRQEMLRRLAAGGGPEELAYVLRHEELSDSMLRRVAAAARLRGVRPAGNWETQIRRWLGSESPALRAAAIELVASWQMQQFAAEMEQFATDPAEVSEVRSAAAAALVPLRRAEAITIWDDLSRKPEDWQLACAALGSWAQLDTAAAAKRAAELIDLITTEQEARELLAALLVRKAGASALADALSELTIPAAAAGHLRRAASAAAVSHEELTSILDRALGLQSVQQEHDPAWIKELADEVLTLGDAERGKEVFQSAHLNCAACHAIYGKGEKVGPDLSSLGRGMPIDRIIEAVVWPAREIKEGYVSITIFTNDGKVFQGIKVSESPAGIVLLDAVTKKEQMIPWRTVEEFEAAGTLMPSGLTSGLPRADLRDLIRYLSQLDGSKLRPADAEAPE
jgi:putative heme-binding domain-containing protein